MNLNQLYYFVTLAHMEHYTRAAQKLSITQPSLSHSISSLENELGTSLFEKQGRNVVLTQYGKLFLEYAEESLRILDAGIKKTRAMTCATGGRIDLGYIYTQGIEFVPELVKNFLAENPEKRIEFGLKNGMTSEIVQGLKEERFDVGFCSGTEKDKELEFIPVAVEQLVLAVPEGHPLFDRKEVTFEELAEYPQIFFNTGSGLRRIVDQIFESYDIKPKIMFEVDEDTAMAGMVAKGFGVGILPDVATIRNSGAAIVQIKNLNYRRYIYMVTVNGKYQSPVVRDFILFVKEHYGLKIEE